jgi:outer membrane receptor protein involved in Fe transport
MGRSFATVLCGFFSLVTLFTVLSSAKTNSGSLTGKVVSESSGEPLAKCNIHVLPILTGVTADSLGSFSLRLPYGTYTLEFTFVGFEKAVREIELSALQETAHLNVRMKPKALDLQEVNIEGKPEPTPSSVQRMEQEDIHNLPMVNKNFLHSIQILPGTAANNELSSAYNVRGGNYDENLIYLNGYEIYRPFLLRQGVEENQSLINSDMVEGIQFYNGAFPASYGDKMSSALEVKYAREHETRLTGVIRADLLSQGVSLSNHIGGLNWSIGLRHANPNLFVRTLQTSGSYRPFFTDAQLLATYLFSPRTSLEIFALDAYNKFRLTPKNWAGHFLGLDLYDVKSVVIDFTGQREYAFSTSLVGLKFAKILASQTDFTCSVARYTTSEAEDADLTDSVYFDDNAWEPSPAWLLKTRFEREHNHLSLQAYEIRPSLQRTQSAHAFRTGLDLRWIHQRNRLNEFFAETGQSTALIDTLVRNADADRNLNSQGGYVQDVITFNVRFQTNLGVRILHYNYNDETLLSPRAALRFHADEWNTFTLGWGFYYQPPFFYELRNWSSGSTPPLKSQRAIHYVLGWEHQFERDLNFQAEAFYKRLDHLIPYYLDQMKLEYADRNNLEGYAYGLDVLLHGELKERINSWISYSYLNTRERKLDGHSEYQRRLLDQTHTLRFFLQDKMLGHANIQAHNRMLFGSGFLFHPQKVVTDSASGGKSLVVDFESWKAYPMYFRADLGFSVRLRLGKNAEAVIVAEVLNAFNRANVASYSWFPIFPDDPEPVKVPQVLSERFFNVGVEVTFK